MDIGNALNSLQSVYRPQYNNSTSVEQIGGLVTSNEKVNKSKAEATNKTEEPVQLADNSLSKSEKSATKETANEPTNEEPTEKNNSQETLSKEDQAIVGELKKRDTEVRAHEQAHLSAAGGLAQGGANFSYESGPDGKKYAVGGEVSIDTSAVAGDPQATIIKAQKIRSAANAPADPSSQDRSVAAQASRMVAQAQTELSQQTREKKSAEVSEKQPENNLKNDQNEKNIQDTYQKIQNAQVLSSEKNFVDFFI